MRNSLSSYLTRKPFNLNGPRKRRSLQLTNVRVVRRSLELQSLSKHFRNLIRINALRYTFFFYVKLHPSEATLYILMIIYIVLLASNLCTENTWRGGWRGWRCRCGNVADLADCIGGTRDLKSHGDTAWADDTVDGSSLDGCVLRWVASTGKVAISAALGSRGRGNAWNLCTVFVSKSARCGYLEDLRTYTTCRDSCDSFGTSCLGGDGSGAAEEESQSGELHGDDDLIGIGSKVDMSE